MVRKTLTILFCSFFVACASSGQQLVNGGFEKWKKANQHFVPIGWSCDLDAAFYHSPSKEAVKDSFALVLSTWYSYVPGHLFYGEHNEPDYHNWTTYTVPFAGKPRKLTGYYRYTHTVNSTDSALCQVLIKDMKGDTLSYGEILLDTTANWTSFEVTLLYKKTRQKPASIAIHFVSVANKFSMNNDNNPNRLYLDELHLVYKKED